MANELKNCMSHGAFRGPECPACGNQGKLLMRESEIEGVGRIIAGMLRHFPENYGVKLDDHGWVRIYNIVPVIKAQRKNFYWLTSIVVGSVTGPADAEKVLEKSDFVAVGRAHLADAYFAEKLMSNPELVKPCIRCNQACRDLGFGEVRCTVNPDVGYELRKVQIPSNTGRIKIVGAGIKGLEAALTAAKAGMSVTVYDMRDSIGGQVLDYWDPKKKEEFGNLINYYGNALRNFGVKFELGNKYTGSDALYCLPDVSYPELQPSGAVKIDSNVYQYHDAALKLASNHKVIMSKRSLASLDRVRVHSYVEAATKAGIEFVEKIEGKPDVEKNQRLQYDIRAAMISGREALKKYLDHNSRAHL